MNTSRRQLGLHVLRISIALIFLYFGFSQLFDSLRFVDMVPTWATNIIPIPPAMVIMGNGIFEVILGSLLAMNLFTRLVSAILALHLLPIIYEFGFTQTGMRDLCIALSSFSIFLIHDSLLFKRDI